MPLAQRACPAAWPHPHPSTRGNHSATAPSPSDHAGAPPGPQAPRPILHRRPVPPAARDPPSAGGALTPAASRSGQQPPPDHPSSSPSTRVHRRRIQHLRGQRHRSPTVCAVQPLAWRHAAAPQTPLAVLPRCPDHYPSRPPSEAPRALQRHPFAVPAALDHNSPKRDERCFLPSVGPAGSNPAPDETTSPATPRPTPQSARPDATDRPVARTVDFVSPHTALPCAPASTVGTWSTSTPYSFATTSSTSAATCTCRTPDVPVPSSPSAQTPLLVSRFIASSLRCFLHNLDRPPLPLRQIPSPSTYARITVHAPVARSFRTSPVIQIPKRSYRCFRHTTPLLP
jgi:hypothetical protein